MTTLTVEFGKVQKVRRAIAVGQVAARRDDDGVTYWLDRYAREAHDPGRSDRSARPTRMAAREPAAARKTATTTKELRKTS